MTVTGFSHVDDGNSYWICDCDCGNRKTISANLLKRGNTKSCGCLKVYKHPRGMTGLRKLYRSYRGGAKKFGRHFDLTIEEFQSITSQDCFYCGSKPTFIAESIWCHNLGDENKTKHTEYVYNGIDRIDSSKGYDQDNIVPCCKWCNIAKSNKTAEEFKEHISKMFHHMALDS